MNPSLMLALLATVAAALVLPHHLNVLVLLPSWFLVRSDLRTALLVSLVIGLLVEPFSPWRLGFITLQLIGTVLLINLLVERFLSVSGLVRIALIVLLAALVFALPSLVVTGNLTALLFELALTTAVGLVLLTIGNVRRRNLHSRV